jgi:hypothetical protein
MADVSAPVTNSKELCMTAKLFFKAILIWLVIAILAVGNGVFRESVLVPTLGHGLALPMSGISLSIIVFIVTYLSFGFIGKKDVLTYFLIGFQWVLMTLLFEFAFGHYVAGKSWSILIKEFDITKGNLFIFVLLMSLISPFLVAKIKRVQ